MMLKEMTMHESFSQKRILVIDKEEKSKNDRTWCFWDDGNMFQEIIQHQWENLIFKTDKISLTNKINPYHFKKIESKSFYKSVIDDIQRKLNVSFIIDEVKTIDENENYALVKTTDNIFQAQKVFNSILFDNTYKSSKKHPLLNQHFIGWFIKTKEPIFDELSATYMDFSVDQKNNTRFMYVLPTSKNEALLEYTLFSPDLLTEKEYEDEIINYIHKLGVKEYEITEKERGNIPMTCYPFWKKNTEKIIHIGTAGGWTKASTGFTFKKTYKKSKELVQLILHNKSIKKLSKNRKYLFYDLLFIDVLYTDNSLGSKIFSSLFEKQKTSLILKFLDEETKIFEDLKVLLSCPKKPFIKALIKRCLK